MALAALTFLAGLAVLLGAGHLMVGASTHIGVRLGLRPMVVGLTIVAAGTSAPELAVVGQAIAVDDTDLAVGSIIGSNIANVLLVLGLAASAGAIRLTPNAVRFDIPVMIAASVAFLVFAWDGSLAASEGAVMLGGLASFVFWTVARSRSAPPAPEATPSTPAPSVAALVVRLASGVAGLAIAARFVVRGAEDLAVAIGLPELVIGLTVVALGTSAPEIATTVIAATRGQRDLAVGNAVGSNIFNILLVLGMAGLVAPGGLGVSEDALRLDLPVLVAAAFACLPIVAFDHRIERWEGLLFVGFYLAYVGFLFLDGTDNAGSDPFGVVIFGFVAPLAVVTLAVLARKAWRRRHRRTDSPTKVLPNQSISV